MPKINYPTLQFLLIDGEILLKFEEKLPMFHIKKGTDMALAKQHSSAH